MKYPRPYPQLQLPPKIAFVANYSLVLAFAVLFGTQVYAQDDERLLYEKNMQVAIDLMGKATEIKQLEQAISFFETTHEEQPQEWLPPYYTAYCYLTMTFMEQNTAIKDTYLDLAQENLHKAETLDPLNNEIKILQAYIYQKRVEVSPQTRLEEYGTLAVLTLEEAEKNAPNNPRIYFLRAQNLFFAPEQNGGGLDRACPEIRKAAEKYAQFVPQNPLMPKWGAGLTDYMFFVCQEQGK